MKPDIKLYDDHIEIAGMIKGDLNTGGNFDIDAGKGSMNAGSMNANKITASDLSVGSESNPGSIVCRGGISAGHIGVEGMINVDSIYVVKRFSMGLMDIYRDEGIFIQKLNYKERVTNDLSIRGGGLLLSRWPWDQKQPTLFTWPGDFETLTARVDRLEKILKQQVRKEAYQRWEAGGRQSGRALDDWLAAERDLLGK